MILRLHRLLFLVITFINITFSQNFWEKLQSPTENFLRSLYFADSLRGWVAGDSGAIFYTSDGGFSWTQQQTNTTNKIMKLFFLDDNIGWALAWSEFNTGSNSFMGTEILKTIDGGNNWIVEQYREEDTFLKGIYFLDTLKGFMGGEPGKFLVTSDGGSNWQPAKIDSGNYTHFPVIDFKFYNNLYGFACGGRFDIAGVVWKTTNGGDNWTPIDAQYSPPDEVWDIHFFDSLHVMGIGGDPDYFGVGLMHSTDAGNSWNYFEIGIFGQALAVSFRTENEGWAVVPQAELFVTTFDYGVNWFPFQVVDSTRLYDLQFTDSLTGYAVGEQGVILKYKYQQPDEVISETVYIIDNFKLYQNYPNPFNSSTTINYNLSESKDVSIKVYNILGNQIATLVEDFKPMGKYHIIWNANSAASGVYYVQMLVDGKMLTQKIVLLK